MKIKKIEKKILCRIFLNNLEKKRTVKNIQKYLDIEKKELDSIINNLISKQLIKKIKTSYILTEKGRKNIKVVFT